LRRSGDNAASADLRARLKAHNAGNSPHTSKFSPWELITYVAFSAKTKALDFERYLKSHSGKAFSNKRLW
jgi:predicted GIY-YIG superfamily endonuclease